MKRFSISDIECLTNIKAHTIRIWEQRYCLITPKRTETNIRYYDDQDLRKFLNISLLLDSGLRISEVAKMSNKEISSQILKLAECEVNGCSCTISSLCNAMLTLDELMFNRTMENSINSLSMEQTMLEVIFPFLHKVGMMWQAGTINPAHEHFITHLIKQRLIAAIHNIETVSSKMGRKYMLFLPEGENHEISLLFANFLIKSRGHHVLYLGQNLPLDDLEEVANFYNPDYIITFLISGTHYTDPNQLVQKLLETLPRWPLLVSGSLVINNNIKSHERLKIVRHVPELIDFINNNAEVNNLYFTC